MSRDRMRKLPALPPQERETRSATERRPYQKENWSVPHPFPLPQGEG